MDNPAPAPPPPPPTQAPKPAPAPASPVKPASRRKFPIVMVLFFIIGLIILVVASVMTGLASKIVPGLGQTTITYWGLWEQDSIMRPLLDEFEKTHPGIKVDYVVQSPQEYRERLQSGLSQGSGPDVFRIHNTWLPMFKNFVAPVPTSVISTTDFGKTYFSSAATDLKLGSDFAGIPLEYDGIAMYINDGILNQHGISVPKNWEDLRNNAMAMSECVTDDGACKNGAKIIISGAALGATANVDHWQDIIGVLMLQNNVNLNNISSPTTKPAEDVIEYFNSFQQSLGIWNPNLPNSTTFFASGKVGIYFGPSWRYFDIKSLNPNLKFSVHPLPQLPVDPARNEAPITYSSYWVEAVNKQSPRAKNAWELLAYLSSPEVLKKFHDLAIQSGRQFGEPYSRKDMLESLSEPAKTFASQGLISRSWYLASFTHDGQTGINTRLSDLFAKAINRTTPVTTLAKEVAGVLSEYGLASFSPAQ